jgi:hypothetical protein
MKASKKPHTQRSAPYEKPSAAGFHALIKIIDVNDESDGVLIQFLAYPGDLTDKEIRVLQAWSDSKMRITEFFLGINEKELDHDMFDSKDSDEERSDEEDSDDGDDDDEEKDRDEEEDLDEESHEYSIPKKIPGVSGQPETQEELNFQVELFHKIRNCEFDQVDDHYMNTHSFAECKTFWLYE